MDARVIIAIIRRDKLEEVENSLKQVGVEMVNVSRVKGYGEYQNFFASDWMVDQVRIEIITRSDEVDSIASALLRAAHSGLPGDGIVAVIPTEKLYLIRTCCEATPSEFWPRTKA